MIIAGVLLCFALLLMGVQVSRVTGRRPIGDPPSPGGDIEDEL